MKAHAAHLIANKHCLLTFRMIFLVLLWIYIYGLFIVASMTRGAISNELLSL